MSQSAGSAPKRTGGGAATSAGVEFQNRIAAWLAVRILAETDAQPLWGWSNQSSLRFFRCETEQPVDDILVGNSSGELAFIQVKRTISAGSGSDSQLASVFGQFVRQYLRPAFSADTNLPWSRRFDACRDRLILAAGPESSATISENLRNALTKLRQLPGGAGIDDPSFNQLERGALDGVRRHLDNAWSAASGVPANAPDIVSLLRATYVEVIDAEPQGSGEREAKELLRHSILEQPGQADLAWSKLLELCAGFARSRGGAGQPELTQALSASGVALKVAPSYRKDVEMLRAYSQQTVKVLARFSDIRIAGTTRIKIDRVSTVELRAAAKTSSLLVIGEPGAGKSAALHDLARDLLKEGAAIFCLATDEVAATSTADLGRELGIEHPLTEVLANWGGPTRPVFFITDALDAARSDHAGDMFRNVIEGALELNASCRVIASIRMFDLKHDSRLRALFTGKPHSSPSHPDFGNTSHFLVPVLNDDELRQLAAQSESLDRLVRAVLAGDNADMRRLIAVPFHLRLLGELVGEGVAVESLTPIRTQIELLDRYWRARILREGKDKLGDARETVLRKVARSMFDSRLLHAPRSVVNADPAESATLLSLLSADVLQEYRPGALDGQGPQTLKFPHHLLFDYALSRLLMRVGHGSLAALIAAEPDCVVAFRPSLVLHFRHLWEDSPADHGSFWTLLLLLNRHPDIPLVGKILGPAVAADHFKDLNDLAPLLAAIKESVATEDGRRLIVQVVSYLIGAQAAKEGIRRDDGGFEAARWAEVAAMLAGFVEVMAYPLRHLLMLICYPAEGIPDSAKPKAGEAGRCLLAYALRSDVRYDGSLVRVALEAVARTFSSDPAASHEALARLVEAEQAAKHGHTELFFLAQEVRWLLRSDPAFVGEIYKVAFTVASDSNEKTHIGGASRILPLISNVRQDWQGVHYSLAKRFPDFVRRAPREAISAAMAAVAAYIEQKHPRTDREAASGKFTFLGESATITTDFSSIWDAEGTVTSRDGGSAMELLGAVTRHLGTLDGAEDKATELADLLKLVAREGHHAVVWRRLLQEGAEHPVRLGKLLAELATRNAVLECFDTIEPIGDLLTASYPSLGMEERTAVELALLAFSSREGAKEEDERLRDRYLGCLPRELVATDKARERLGELDSTGGAPPNTPHFQMGSFEESDVSDEDFLRHQGIPVDAPANRHLLDLTRPLKTKFKNGKPQAPDPEEPAKRLERLRSIKASLESNLDDAAVTEVQRQALGYLADACSTVLKSPADPAMAELTDFAREMLLEIASTVPEGPLQTNEQFDRMPSWGSPHAFIAAAEGLLLNKDTLAPVLQNKVDAAVDRLMRSPAPEVRFQVAHCVGVYFRANEQRMWTILSDLAENDPSSGVLSAVINTVSRTRSAAGVGLAEQIFRRSDELAEGGSVREMCLSYFLVLHVQAAIPSVWTHLEPIAKAPWLHLEDAQRLISGLRDSLAFGSAELEKETDAQLRKRGQELFRLIVQSASDEFSRLLEEYQNSPAANVPEEVQKRSGALQQVIQSAADEIYFASGAFAERTPSDSREKLTTAQRRRFWIEMRDVIHLLSGSKVPSVSYHLIETLETLVPFDPKTVFLEISRAVQCGKAGGFQFESLVADIAVRLVREFIATHRALLKDDKECRRALIDVLDTFVEAGWPAAQKLTFGLQDIFR